VPNVIKIDVYNVGLYRFKVGAFFLRHSVDRHAAVYRRIRQHALFSRSLLSSFITPIRPYHLQNSSDVKC